MNYQKQTQRLIQSYENAVAWWCDADHGEALHEAVRTAFPGIGEDGQAELYTQIAEAWEGYRTAMIPRKLWIGQIVVSFMSNRTSVAVGGLTVSNNVPTKSDQCGACDGRCTKLPGCRLKNESPAVDA
jgi:hypothetical protein